MPPESTSLPGSAALTPGGAALGRLRPLGEEDGVQLPQGGRAAIRGAAGRRQRQDFGRRHGVAVPLPHHAPLTQHDVITGDQVPEEAHGSRSC